MSVVINSFEFGEYDFGSVPFGSTLNLGNQGSQAQYIIKSEAPYGMQVSQTINSQDNNGQQAQFIVNSQTAFGQQGQLVIEVSNPIGFQANQNIQQNFDSAQQALYTIADGTQKYGHQTQFVIEAQAPGGQQVNYRINTEKLSGQQANYVVEQIQASGQEVLYTYLVHKVGKGGFGEEPFGTLPFGAVRVCANQGQQVEYRIVESDGNGQQATYRIESQTNFGQQTTYRIESEPSVGMQVEYQSVEALGMQSLFTIYNATNFRILCDFSSRGLDTVPGGNNAWGNALGTGLNWVSNSTETGDFLPENVNTDVVEQYTRTATGTITGWNLDCDTERAQGIFLDTFALLNHNFTASATVQLIGSVNSNFSTTDFITNLTVLDPDIYYIAPTLPTQGIRYWRISVSDPGNTNGFLQIGTVVFGASQIFSDECFIDQIDFKFNDFASKLNTEGFTNVSNSRTLKKQLELTFQALNFSRGNFDILRELFKNERTTLKCLYIPTPNPTDASITARYAVFGKLRQIPNERHNYKTETYVDVVLDIDESL